MNRKAFRCGVLALLLTAAFALPAISAISRVPAKPGLHSPRPAVERGILERVWEVVTGFLGGSGGRLRSLSGANREGIDPNGLTINDPPKGGSSATPSGSDRSPSGGLTS